MRVDLACFTTLNLISMSEILFCLDAVPAKFHKELGLVGKIPLTQSAIAPCFSYCLYIPPRYDTLETLPLLVLMHSSDREACRLRDNFSALAEQHGCAILCPLFPRLLQDPYDTGNYKMILYEKTRYDLILLSMVEELAIRYTRIDIERFFLFGFSGGGQFVHRFAYLHPTRLLGLAVGAPGTITLPDPLAKFPKGVKDTDTKFGIAINWKALRAIPSMFLAGGDDTDNLSAIARGRRPIPGGRHGGTVELEKAWAALGANSRFVTVPDVAHVEVEIIPTVVDFFGQILERSKI